MTCEYCTPNHKGKREALHVERVVIQREPYLKIKSNITRIYRKRNKNKTHFIGTHSMDLIEGRTVSRNNGFIMKKDINYCPICARDLNKPLEVSDNA